MFIPSLLEIERQDSNLYVLNIIANFFPILTLGAQISSIYHVIILQVKIQGQIDIGTCKTAQLLSTLVLKACPEFNPQKQCEGGKDNQSCPLTATCMKWHSLVTFTHKIFKYRHNYVVILYHPL